MDSQRHSQPQQARPTIGLLAEVGRSPYHRALWTGFIDAAPALGTNLIWYMSRALNAPGHDTQHSVFDLLIANKVDGLIISGTLGNYVTTAEFASFIDRYRPLPMVGITQAPGLPSVIVDNGQGMRDMVTHFIEVHGYRRIAFICGPENNEEAALRYRAYVDALTEHGLSLDPDLVAPGTFNYQAGMDAVRLLLDERKAKFDALVAANDWMAFGALRALEVRGVRVPDDVALGGFDDTKEAAASNPPLTTVQQPTQQLGYAGIKVMLKLLAGEQIPEQTLLPTKLVVRRSCGCVEQAVTRAAAGSLTRKKEPLRESIIAQRQEIISEMVRVLEGSRSSFSEWAGQLLDAFLEEMSSDSTTDKADAGSALSEQFCTTLDNVLRQVNVKRRQLNNWQEVISVIRRYTLPYLSDIAALSRAEDLFNQGRVAISGMIQRNWAYQEVEEKLQAEMQSNLGDDLVAAVETEQILDVVAHRLPQLGFWAFYLSFYGEQERPTQWSGLMLAHEGGRRVEVDAGGRRFPTGQLIPDEMIPQKRRYTWVVAPLNFGDNQFGYLALEVGPRNADIYSSLTRQISGALQNSLLLQKHRQAEEILARQAQELARSNAELEQFAYVASHDLQEPLRKVNAFGDRLRARYADVLDEQGRDYLTRVLSAAERMQNLISSLLTYSRATTQTRPFVPVELTAVAREVLSDLETYIEQVGGRVLVTDLPTVKADPTQMRQLLQNLIGNALKFRRKDEAPIVKVYAKANPTGHPAGNGLCQIVVEDNGIGFDEQHLDRIFQVFQRLHGRSAYEGSGVGLAICRKIVERHGGSIAAQSTPGQGTTFTVTLPIKQLKGEKEDDTTEE
jgi:DNA-binding LacI/PurR family transcriptional regulator/signal transduction histidine kinase